MTLYKQYTHCYINYVENISFYGLMIVQFPKHDSLHIVNNLIGWSYMECIMLIYMSYSNYVFRFFVNISQVIERFI